MSAATDQSSAPYQLTEQEVARQFDTSVDTGLSTAEVHRRLAQAGPNTLQTQAPTPPWRRLLAQLQDPLVYLLLAASFIILVVWALEGRRGWPMDALVILAVVVLNALLGFVQETRSRRAAEALIRLTGVTSAVLRDGVPQRVPSTELVCGDLLLLSEGDSVGADARLIQASVLRVQEASLTGESEAVLKAPAPLLAATPLAERRNMVFKGTAVAQGSGQAVVTATGMATEIGAIAHLLNTTIEEATPLQKEVRQIGSMLGRAVVLICIAVIAAVLLVSNIRTLHDLVSVLLLGVSLAVAAVPEGLPAILSLVLAMGVQRMAGRKAIVKNLSSVEALGSASVICSDKTGTLTRSEMTIERAVTSSGSSRVGGVGYAPEGQLHHLDQAQAGEVLSHGPMHSEHIVLLSGGSLAGNADLRQAPDGNWVIQGDPTEAAFLVAERKLGVHERRQARFERIADIPFTSDRKMMSTLAIDHEHDGERVIIAKGAPDVLLAHCTRVRVGLEVRPLSDDVRAQALADVNTLSDAALRTLSVAYRPLAPDEHEQQGEALERDLIFVGTVGIIDPPRAEAAQAIREAHRAGIRVIMITGDHPRTAARIASDLGIVAPGATALTGADLDAMDDARLAEAVGRTSVYARVAPAHKLRIVKALQAQGHVVAMTGDGVNDAPALKLADIGVAMGITGTEVTKEAGQMILADDNFATIVAAVREGRNILDNIRKFLRYLLSSNMGEVLTVLLAVVGARVLGLIDASGDVVLPLLATQLLWINLITDSGPALAMGVDPSSDDVMARRPRNPSDRVIDARMWATVLQSGLALALATLVTLDLFLPGGLLEGTQDLTTARTAAFTVLVMGQFFNAFNARSDTDSAFQGLFNNSWLWAAVALGLALQIAVVELPWLNLAFGTAPLTLAQWGLCAAMGSAVLWVSELRKLGLRHRGIMSGPAHSTRA
ncbi:cation-translocating P-type ATPase [Aquabacterium sp.]|uniref:cation-translocating P-type ATPase n=1 Tax=Aquabacterium sp. TaxID=1872578 RepID=UPI0040382B42